MIENIGKARQSILWQILSLFSSSTESPIVMTFLVFQNVIFKRMAYSNVARATKSRHIRSQMSNAVTVLV